MTGTNPFSPALPTVQLASATTSSNVALGTKGQTSESVPTPQGYPTFPGGYTVEVSNVGTSNAQIVFGTDSTVSATSAAGIMVAANTTRRFGVNPNITYMAQIANGTASVLYATPGQGGT